MWDYMYGFNHSLLGALSMFLMPVLLIILIIIAIRYLSSQYNIYNRSCCSNSVNSGNNIEHNEALDILKKRLASGEITIEEYNKTKEILSNN